MCFSCPSNERLFLRDFVLAAAGTSGGRLAHWLQPDPYVDVSRCELVPLRNGPPSGPHPATAPTLRCDCPATFTLHIRDQYGNPVQVPNLKVSNKPIFPIYILFHYRLNLMPIWLCPLTALRSILRGASRLLVQVFNTFQILMDPMIFMIESYT